MVFKRSASALTLAWLGFALGAQAHSVRHPKRVALFCEREQVQVAIDLELAAGHAAQGVRQTFDKDHDGKLDAEEQERLLAYLGAEAARGTRLSLSAPLPGWRGWFGDTFAPLPLLPLSPPRGERTDDAASSRALLAVHVVLHAQLPAPRSASETRTLKLEDDSSAEGGHVPVSVGCKECQIVSSTLGVSAQASRGDQVLGADVTPARPLVLSIRFPH